MYALHPFTVHFPIALLLASTLLTLLALRFANPSLETSAYHCLILGMAGTVVAIASGLWDAIRQQPLTNELQLWVNGHAIGAILAGLIYGRLLLARRKRPQSAFTPGLRRSYLGWHLTGAALLLLTGWVGGHLVYVLGLGITAER